MDWVKPFQAWAQQWWAYATWCLEHDFGAPVCRPFWTWVTIACGAVVVLGVVFIAGKIVSYRLKLAAALRAEEERQHGR